MIRHRDTQRLLRLVNPKIMQKEDWRTRIPTDTLRTTVSSAGNTERGFLCWQKRLEWWNWWTVKWVVNTANIGGIMYANSTTPFHGKPITPINAFATPDDRILWTQGYEGDPLAERRPGDRGLGPYLASRLLERERSRLLPPTFSLSRREAPALADGT